MWTVPLKEPNPSRIGPLLSPPWLTAALPLKHMTHKESLSRSLPCSNLLLLCICIFTTCGGQLETHSQLNSTLYFQSSPGTHTLAHTHTHSHTLTHTHTHTHSHTHSRTHTHTHTHNWATYFLLSSFTGERSFQARGYCGWRSAACKSSCAALQRCGETGSRPH